MNINELLSDLKNRNSILKKEKEEIESKRVSPLTNLKEDINKVIKETEKIIELDLDTIIKEIPNIDNNILNKLRLYTKFYKNNINVNQEQEKYIKDSLNKIKNSIEEKTQNTDIESPEIALKNKEIQEIEKIIKYLNDLLIGEYLEGKVLEEIADYLKKADYISEMKKVGVLSEIVLTSYNNINNLINEKERKHNTKKETKQDNKPVEANEIKGAERTGLNEKEVLLLFNKYGFNFKDFKREDQEVIISYASIDEMNKMLEIIQNNHILLNIKERGTNISRVLTFSDSETLNNIINNIKEDIKRIPKRTININTTEIYDVNKIFQNYLKENSIFIKKQKYFKLKNNKMDIVLSSYNSYLNNRELFNSVGIDIKRASIKSPEAFTYSTNKVKENIESLNYYNIPLEIYEEKLTVLKSSDIQGTIDQFIEVGYFEDYALHNPTRLILKNDDILFYRIIKSKQEGRSYRSLFYGDSHKFKGEITSLTSKLFDMTDSNKSSLVGEYHPHILSDFEKINPSLTNELISQSNYINALEQFKIDDYRYNIDGIIVSRKKVLRYYESILREYKEDNIEGLRYGIFKNSIFTKEMCDKINNVLNTIIIQNKGVELK